MTPSKLDKVFVSSTTFNLPSRQQFLNNSTNSFNSLNIDNIYSYRNHSSFDVEVTENRTLNYSQSAIPSTMSTIAGNTLGTALNIGSFAVGSNRSFRDSIGATNREDYYHFSLTNASNLNLSLSGVSSFTNVELIFDANNNGVYESNERLSSGYASGFSNGAVNTPLASGTYFVRVSNSSSSSTGYTLGITTTTAGITTPADPGNTLRTAFNIGSLPTVSNRSFRDFVGTTDQEDYYRFSLTSPSNLNLSLSGVNASTNLELIFDANNNGVYDSGERLSSGFASSFSNGAINTPLGTGTYFVRVATSLFNSNTTYTLGFTTTAATTTPIDPGSNLRTALNIGSLTTPSNRSFRDFVGTADQEDYYRFSLTSLSNLNLSLSGVNAFSNLELIFDANNNGVYDSGERLSSGFASSFSNGTINTPLAAGTYFVRVSTSSSNNTAYSLTITTTAVATTTPVDPGNNLGAALNIGTFVSGSNRTLKDFVGSSDHNDFYRFTVTGSNRLNLSLTELSTGTYLQLVRDENSNGVYDTGEELDSVYASKFFSGSITTNLRAGTYFARIYTDSATANTTYSLSISTTGLPAFNSIYGYGLVDAAAAVARAIGQSTFANVTNLGGNNWSHDLVYAPEVWARGYTGQGITVAVIDDGVDITHQDLRENIWRNTREIAGNGIDDDGNGYTDDIFGWNFGLNNNNVMPSGSHGTHVAGTIAASNNGFGTTGVAYNAKIMPIRISNNQNKLTGNLARAIRYAVDNGAQEQIDRASA